MLGVVNVPDVAPTGGPEQGVSDRSKLYILIVVSAICATFVYTLARDGIFSCQAHGYGPDRYMAECTAPRYGNYEHGAFWFDLEPPAGKAASSADVLFLGDSRLQVALSTAATTEWFSGHSLSYYLLGFGYAENAGYFEDLLARLRPRAKVYVINADTFFERFETPPARFIKHDLTAGLLYKAKHLLQSIHRPICSFASALCGNGNVVFRSRRTGAYTEVSGGRRVAAPVAYDKSVDQDVAAANVASALEFLQHSRVHRDCIILTSVPYGETRLEPHGTRLELSKAVAAKLQMTLVVPELNGLETFDTSHLSKASAQRWSRAFLEAAGPQISKCVNGA